ncbi:efflux RND transporter periplasmic adaptor subunit [Pseudomonas putida]|uniref:Efflux RND transporter periplasmic adaptor subunit n=1 Tax=Pseudomonas putida TaxID=303 RepID=A0A4D6XBY6_PSEPU|nr:efflux RND transporter periplasmic adaptor subunit [Pseudomonas putida]QCI11960.1 efflux RND transporter periplasmic adaptor subunit [Pseudomonas putida]
MNLRILPLLLAMALVGCGNEEQTEGPTVVRPVKLFTVTSQSLNQLRRFPAQLRASDEVAMAFRRGGHLRALPVKDGQSVKKGQLLAEIDDKDLQLQVKDRQSKFDLARAQFQRVETLNQRNLISRAEFDQRRAERDTASAALRLAQNELSFSRLLAPFDGTVAKVAVQNHHVVQAGQAVVIMHSSNTLDVTFQMQANLVKEIETNAKSKAVQPQVSISRVPDRTFPATYKDHSTAPDPATLTYTVTYTIERPADLNLLPGMSATLELDLSQMTRERVVPVVVPAEAVFAPDDKPGEVQVWVAEEQGGALVLSGRRVEVGQLTRDGIEVLTGLQPGDRVVAVGGAELHAGQPVREWTRERGL